MLHSQQSGGVGRVPLLATSPWALAVSRDVTIAATHVAIEIPLYAVGLDARVDADGIVVALVAHQLHAAVVKTQGQHWAVGLSKTLQAVVPLNPNDVAGS